MCCVTIVTILNELEKATNKRTTQKQPHIEYILCMCCVYCACGIFICSSVGVWNGKLWMKFIENFCPYITVVYPFTKWTNDDGKKIVHFSEFLQIAISGVHWDGKSTTWKILCNYFGNICAEEDISANQPIIELFSEFMVFRNVIEIQYFHNANTTMEWECKERKIQFFFFYLFGIILLNECFRTSNEPSLNHRRYKTK